jgi:DNA polymerase III alpha subunit (gram-positive type)
MPGYKNSLFMIVGVKTSIQDNFELLNKTFQNVGIDFYTAWKTNLDDFDKDIEIAKPKIIFALGTEVRDFLDIKENFKFTISPKYNHVVVAINAPNDISNENFINQLLPIESNIAKVRNKTFINLHHHNQFSLRDGLGSEIDIAKYLDLIKSPGFSLTNHRNINCHYRQYKAAKEYGLKPVFGTEIYYNQFRDKIIDCLNTDSKEATQERKRLGEFTYHLTVIAMNQKGYYNLISMNNEALMNSFYKFPLIDDRLLLKYREGLTIFSGCGGSYISVNLFQDSKAAYEKADFFKQNFPDNFYVELMSTKYEHQKFLNQRLVNLSKDLHLPTIVTNDSHYIKHGHHKIHDILLLAGTDTTLEDLTDPATKVWTFSVKDLYIKTPDELYSDLDFLKTDEYNEEVLTDSISNVHKVFAKIEPFEIDTSFKYPKLGEEDSIKFLQKLIADGIRRRKIVVDDEIKARLQEEYETITKMGFTDYFLCLQDLLNHIKDNYGRYSVGPGRGCFLPDSMIKMSDNTRVFIKDIKKGNVVKNFFNKKATVTNIFEYNINEDIIELEFESNKIIRCTKDHKFLTKNRGWIEAQFLNENDIFEEI